MENGKEYYSFWYTRLQGALYLMVLLTWGFGDAITSLWMIEQQGLMREGNLIARYIISYYGASNFIMIKVSFTLMVLFFALQLQVTSHRPVYWMINGYLFSFIVGGTLAMILNIQAAMNVALIILPQQVILLYISLVLILTNIGEVIDTITHPRIRNYFDCALNDISLILAVFNNYQSSKDSEPLN